MIRIRSEHAIGFLKGRCQSLKSVRVNIVDERTHKFATYWVLACATVHTFAMKCEAEEKSSDEDPADDPFVAEGHDYASSSESDMRGFAHQMQQGARSLEAAKAKRTQLKNALLRAREKRQWRRRAQEDSDEEDSDVST